MWKLIKTDLYYNRIYIVFGSIFLILMNLPYFITGDVETELVMYAPASLAIWMFIFSRWGSYMFFKDNLERVHASLPLPYKDIAKARLFTGLVLWSCYLSFIMIAYSLFSDVLTRINFWGIFFLNGLALTINAFIYVWHDFIFIKPGKYRKRISYLFYYPVAFSLIGLIYFSTSAAFPMLRDIQLQIQSYFFNGIGVVVTNAFGIGLTFLSYYMYQNRYSYLVSEFGLKSNIRVKTGDIS